MGSRTVEQLRQDALGIWRAGVEAVRADRLMEQAVRLEADQLQIGLESIRLAEIRRIVVVGAGKAGAGMAAALEEILGPRLMEEKELTGWVNVPADCVRPLRRIRLHPARPPGLNEPTEEGLRGTEEILRLVASAGPEDLCLCLISGGGSALLPAPIEGIRLADKLAVTRFLSAAGANIEQLNTVRKQLSRVKGGRLAQACRAGRLVSLIISDVLGDPLEVIASGPTVPDSSTPEAALEVLRQFQPRPDQVPERVWHVLEALANQTAPGPKAASQARQHSTARSIQDAQHQAAHGLVYVTAGGCRVVNWIIGNNATAVRAASQEARRRGYSPVEESAQRSEGLADDLGIQLAQRAMQMRAGPGPDCLVSGGEPVVQLVEPARRGRGGRNQQLVLAALNYLLQHDRPSGDSYPYKTESDSPAREAQGAAAGSESACLGSTSAQAGPIESQKTVLRPGAGMVLLSGGTDGEDGPTDAAGAWVDEEIIQTALRLGLQPEEFLARNDAYRFFAQTGSLIRTGPTHTNVCDLRVILVARKG